MRIEKNVPLPDNIKKRVRIGPLPLREMEIGDSIFIEADFDEDFAGWLGKELLTDPVP